jgi:hypothetical protein
MAAGKLQRNRNREIHIRDQAPSSVEDSTDSLNLWMLTAIGIV